MKYKNILMKVEVIPTFPPKWDDWPHEGFFFVKESKEYYLVSNGREHFLFNEAQLENLNDLAGACV